MGVFQGGEIDIGRDQALGRRHLGDDRLEARIEEGHDIGAAFGKFAGDQVGDRVDDIDRQHLGTAEIEALDDLVGELALQLVTALAADGDDPNPVAGSGLLGDEFAGGADDVRVEPAGQAAVGGGDDDQLIGRSTVADQHGGR